MNTQSEITARDRINTTLTLLGWRLHGTKENSANVRFERDLRNERDRRKLKRKSPDYVLYPDDSDVPIGIIEAKKPNHPKMHEALNQGRRYAEMLEYPKMVIFASDGNLTLAEHITKQPLTINGERVYDLLPQAQVERLADNPQMTTDREIKSIQDLIAAFNTIANELRADGVDAGMATLREACLAMFIKIMSERGRALPGCDWENLRNKRGADLSETYKRIIDQYRRRYDELMDDTSIQQPATLEKLISRIGEFDFSKSAFDVKGGAYEHFLSRYSVDNKSALGQYFTPRHITKMMAQLLNLAPGNKIYDPFCGTGGMLVACYSLIRNQLKVGEESGWLDALNKSTLYGQDIVLPAARLAKMNMVILGDGHSNINRADSLARPRFREFSRVITNIPFSLGSVSQETADQYGCSDTRSDSVCVRHCLEALEEGGEAAIILPETIAYANSYQELRNFIRDNSTIRAVIRLPNEVFTRYTTARTFVLLLQNMWVAKTKDFPIVNIVNDGFTRSTRREPILENDIPELLENAASLRDQYFIQDASGDNFRFFSDVTTPNQMAETNTCSLGDLLVLRETRTRLEPNKLYLEPGLDSATNTVKPRGQPRRGVNISGDKVLAQKGDLMIGVMHTQSRNGLFAFCDQEYVATSQIVGIVREDIVSKPYLAFMLRKILPTLSKSDLVGRESYRRQDILSIPIPLPSRATNDAFIKSAERHKTIDERAVRLHAKIDADLQKLVDRDQIRGCVQK